MTECKCSVRNGNWINETLMRGTGHIQIRDDGSRELRAPIGGAR